MLWIILALVLALGVAFWKWFSSQVHGKNVGREHFERAVRSLLILLEDGGTLHVKCRGPDVTLDLVRSEESGDGATVVVKIPRAIWSESSRSKIHNALVSSAFDVQLAPDKSSMFLAHIRVPVDDIWPVWSGAKPARAVHLVLDALDVPRDAKFDVALDGARSTRGLRRAEPIRGG